MPTTLKRSPKVAEDLFLELRRQILGGVLEPGMRLPPERKLASAFGTNRNTLREAIRRLEQANLVTVRHGQGVTVQDFRSTGTLELLEPFLVHGTDPAEKVRCVEDLLASRTRILEYALEFVVARASDEDLALLEELAEGLVASWTARDREALAEGYAAWLDALIDSANSLPARWIANPLIEMNRSLTDRFPGMWIMDEGFPDYIRTTQGAIRARDIEAAVATHRAYYGRIDAQILPVLGWVIQSGMASLQPSAAETDAEARKRRKEIRKAQQRSRKLSAELAAAKSAAKTAASPEPAPSAATREPSAPTENDTSNNPKSE